MAKFNFNHKNGSIQECMGLESAVKIETTVVKWIGEGLLDEDNKESIT